MIVISPTVTFVRDSKMVRPANLISTEAGATGRAELIAFAVGIGLKSDWIKNHGTVNEHFNLQNARIETAVKAGAQPIDKFRLQSILKRKRERLGLVMVPRKVLRARAIARERHQPHHQPSPE